MNRRGEVEIVINGRWLERAFFILVIVALAIFAIWQYTAKSGTSDAQSQARIATLESQLADTQAKLDNVTLQLTVAKALVAPAAPAATTPPATTPPATTTPSSSIINGGVLKVSWDHDGNYPTNTQYKLTDVTIIVNNGVDRSATFDYELCWSSIECTKTVATGSFSVGAGSDYTFHVPISIPTIVSVAHQQTLSLVVTSADKTVLSDDAIIK